ncbi:MAG: hypothetical protein IJ316_04190 [Clostridia bacterium]|nr:hypothetical protein [Clostridia bacterium]
MKKLAYFKIKEDMTPRDASDILAQAKKAGYDDVLVYHHENADITKAKYKEQLLSVFRAAYRHKVGLYIADDRYDFSGTGFGQLSSVKSLWQKIMVVKTKDQVLEGEEILLENEGECVVVTLPKESDKFPYGHMPDLTNPQCAKLIIESVYKPLINEYKKFVGYEFKGFLCNHPIDDAMEYEGAPYCKETLEKFMESTLDCGDLFAVAEMEESAAGGWGEYLEEHSIDESFAMPLKKFCDENGLEFALVSGSDSVSHTFGEENASIYLNPFEDECYHPEVHDGEGALWAYKYKSEPVIKIMPNMEKFRNIGKIFEEYPDCECVKIGRIYQCDNVLVNTDKDCYIIENSNAINSVSLSFLFEGEWCVYDWEKDELYDFEHKATYTFPPCGFMCIVRKTDTMYTDKLPVRVGSVVTWDYEEKQTLEFEKRDNKYAFYLPDESLSDKAIMIEGDAESMRVKLGAMEHYLTEKPYIMPLFDFQRDAGCLIEVIDGTIDKIAIIEKQAD